MLSLEQSTQAEVRHLRALPRGIRILALARAIRWIGWGLGEALIPIFIVAFSHTFAEMGLFSSTVEIVSLISLPVIGLWADRGPAKTLILVSLLLYPVVGISYFLAGSLGAAVLIVLARAVNGFTWELENVGIETYYRRITHRGKLATSFGFLDTWSNAGWICAALVGMSVVSFIPIQNLLLGISPFALIAYLVVLRAPKDLVTRSYTARKHSIIGLYRRILIEWRSWNSQLRLLSRLVLFSSFVTALTDFFLPIDAYLQGANLPMVVLLAIFGSMPSLFGIQLGRIADTHDKNRLVAFGLLVVAAVALGNIAFPFYWFKLVTVFILGIMVELFSVVKSSLVTTLGPAESYGIRGSAFETIVTVGDLLAPLVIGVILDVLGFWQLACVVAGAAIALAAIFRLKRIENS